ncbi:DUF6233 domain-containing protein [Streptomyces sp. NPDC087866]|uniref:DUF6233 domain-containing protein n=1 Tax=Streptomyces sp. NPDC087866 TaxID=3365815 RepID=UPI00380C790C
MSGNISDLDKNRILVEWLEWQLRQAKNRVRELEVKAEQEKRARQVAYAEQRWKLQPKRGGRPAMLHRGGCTLSAGEHGLLDRVEALVALEEPGVEVCEICRPETGLLES